MKYFLDPLTFKNEFNKRLQKTYNTNLVGASNEEMYYVLSSMMLEEINENTLKTKKKLRSTHLKKTIYFSMEFLIGRLITSNLCNLGYFDLVLDTLLEEHIDLYEILSFEADAGLGNGGLGRLGACFLDSAASMGIPLFGNSLRYTYGFFNQVIKNNRQVETPDNWLDNPFVWENRVDSEAIEIPLYGEIRSGHYENQVWVKAVPYDISIVGDKNGVCNNLRIWKAEKSDYYNDPSVQYLRDIKQITDSLYPDDSSDYGKYLRLKQQYLFSAAGVRNSIREYKQLGLNIKDFHKYYAFQINDTHPSFVIPELMRILMDEEHLEYLDAWEITINTCSFTNHTILQEALEKWPIGFIRTLLPRIFEIIEEINRRFLNDLNQDGRFSEDEKYQMKIVGSSQVRMANLCIVGSHSVNGVAKLHTDILIQQEMHNFYLFFPLKFNNKTNGITHRRWLFHSNPRLCEVIDRYIGTGYRRNFNELENFKEFKHDKKALFDVEQAKKSAKNRLAKKIKADLGISINPNSIFDIQVKRLHEYKRQILNILHIIYVYQRLKSDSDFKKDYYPHTFIFGAKAAPSYYIAKKTIQLINTVAGIINEDRQTNTLLKVVFIPNYNVSYSEILVPACDVSEQISTASKEASGTGNMKFMMNGAITLGTLDGANVEISELVGKDNIVIFGLTSKEVTTLTKESSYLPYDLYQNDKIINDVINYMSRVGSEGEFYDLRNNLLNRDSYFVLKDFHDYRKAHEKINAMYKDKSSWYSKVIVNIASSSFFSSDRTIKQYNDDIWHLKPIK
jgi:starch phosphorylase